MEAQIEIINIKWEGPLTLNDAKKKTGDSDYGVYQCYGDHPVYGSDVLLYIGRALEQTFGKTLERDQFIGKWKKSIQIYLGRIEPKPTSDEAWNDMIARAKNLLLHACIPTYNVRFPDVDRHKELLVLNWGNYRSLLPAVSGYRVIEKSP